MTVKELMAELDQFNPNLTVIIPLHSDYSTDVTVGEMEGFDNGGYISRPYRVVDQAKVKNYVVIG